MSDEKRFLFDECVGKPVMEQIHELVSPDAKFIHIVDYIHEGAKDENWIPRLGTEGGWVVITSDGGKQSRRGQKLPVLCWEHGVTHVVLSAKVHDKKSHEKAGILAAMWGDIAMLHAATPGSRYQLRFRTLKGTATLAVALEPVSLPPPPSAKDEPEQPT